MTTKEKILYESMKLFSTQGFEAVSVRSIAEAVGVTNSALYKHFPSKQAIFNSIVEISKEKYLKQCNKVVNAEIRGIEQVQQVCMEMFKYQTEDEWIVMFRRILLLEQFKNPEIAEIYKEFFVIIPLKKQQMIFEKLIKMGLMKNKNPKVMAMELYAPFFMFHMVKDDEKNLTEMFEQHIEYFFKNYIIEERKQ